MASGSSTPATSTARVSCAGSQQASATAAHIAAARETGLPLIVHARDADDDTVAVLKEEYARGPFPGVIHCFTAGPELAKAALEIGFYISLAGIVTFKSSKEPANVVYTADAMAKLCGVVMAEFADMTTDNFFRLFTRAARP